jgi:hypothetical protein
LNGRAYSLPVTEVRSPRPRADTLPDRASEGTPLHVAVAPGLLDSKHTVIRADDDTDEDYERKQRLLDALLAYAKKQD